MRTETATMNDFVEEVRKDLQNNLSELFPGVTVNIQQVDKIQGGSYLGLRIDRKDGLASPVLNLEQPYQDMKTVRPYEKVIRDITEQAEAVLRDMPQITLGDLNEYDRLKEGLIMQVIPVRGNEERLADMPHRQMEDMAVVYRVMMDTPRHSGEMSFLITNSIMQGYGITPDQLYADASYNMSQNIPYSIRPLFNVLADMNPVFADDPMPEPDNSLYVCTNEMGAYGAGAVAHPEFMEEACKKLHGNFFVLPSSIHEVLLLKDDGHTAVMSGLMPFCCWAA